VFKKHFLNKFNFMNWK